MNRAIQIAENFGESARAVVFGGSCLHPLKQIPDSTLQLVVTSPPYNIGKAYGRG